MSGTRLRDKEMGPSDGFDGRGGGRMGASWNVRGLKGALGNRYVLLCLVVAVMMAGQLTNRGWVADFWGHAASVRELAEHPWAPQDPFVEGGGGIARHHDFSPYTVALGLLSRYSGIGAVGVLTGAGVVNLVLLFVAFRMGLGFVETDDRDGVAFYSLLALLVLWGPDPWLYSGFFHLNVLGWVLPYPSTFAFVLSLFALAVLGRILSGGSRRLYGVLVVLMTVGLLTHPPTAAFMYVGCAALVLGMHRQVRVAELVLTGCAFGGSFVLACLWPYSPLLDLLASDRAVFDVGNHPMYEGVLRRIAPVVVVGGSALVFRWWKRSWRDPLVLMFVGLSVVYAAGFVFQAWSLGRVVSFMVLVLHIAVGWAAVMVEGAARRASRGRLVGFRVAAVCVAGVLCGLFFQPGLERCVPFRGQGYAEYLPLSGYVGESDVVLSDVVTGWPVPGLLGAGIVAPWFPSYYRSDGEKRRRAVEAFFSPRHTTAERREIISSYGVDWVLVGAARLRRLPTVRESLEELGRRVYLGDILVLYRLHEGGGGARAGGGGHRRQ